jgi:hypothetical protein
MAAQIQTPSEIGNQARQLCDDARLGAGGVGKFMALSIAALAIVWLGS